MKINNRGFAISTLLYGLLTLGVMLIMFIFQIMLCFNAFNWLVKIEHQRR